MSRDKRHNLLFVDTIKTKGYDICLMKLQHSKIMPLEAKDSIAMHSLTAPFQNTSYSTADISNYLSYAVIAHIHIQFMFILYSAAVLYTM